jgi:hypothetical protein
VVEFCEVFIENILDEVKKWRTCLSEYAGRPFPFCIRCSLVNRTAGWGNAVRAFRVSPSNMIRAQCYRSGVTLSFLIEICSSVSEMKCLRVAKLQTSQAVHINMATCAR